MNFNSWCDIQRSIGIKGTILFHPSKGILTSIGTFTWPKGFYRIKEIANDNEAVK